jgi:hypothetical protein
MIAYLVNGEHSWWLPSERWRSEFDKNSESNLAKYTPGTIKKAREKDWEDNFHEGDGLDIKNPTETKLKKGCLIGCCLGDWILPT